ncbi:hypothetical protein CCMA1212_001362 [Trichoderma ghanense]|uniref:Zn(2)-C6 fungal-type domain-containing protein n=1 Tax=Trichoderma ghanense TaxID=65468 RepID=A0ABY2HC80_9HYPO
MRTTLRRSCNACAKAKLGCDLRIPQCSRCIKRNSSCVYANKPLNSPLDLHSSSAEASGYSPPAATNGGELFPLLPRDGEPATRYPENPAWTRNPATASFDPFDSYPPTRLPRLHVQRLIHRFLSSIAFQYYPLDLNMDSNPFIVSWWPLALADQALFHVSLQTASLYEELQAQQGFPISDLLMVDSIALHGKGNIEASKMHIDGVKRMVTIRGGIDELKQRSPLTARMVSWVSMLVMEAPQFPTKDDAGDGDGISAIPQWQLASTGAETQDESLRTLDITPSMNNILSRLRSIFHHHSWHSSLTNTQLHDLTCFVVHKLLLLPPFTDAISDADAIPLRLAASECLRYATALHMLIIHGTTYYSHVGLAKGIILQLRHHLLALQTKAAAWTTDRAHSSLEIWALSVGMVATAGNGLHRNHEWFVDQARASAAALGVSKWDDVVPHLQAILWARMPQEELFRQEWERAFVTTSVR